MKNQKRILTLLGCCIFALSSFGQTDPDKSEIFEIYQVQEVARFKGGEKAMYQFISDHIAYPPLALEKGISGRVVVQFVVEKDGSISNIKIRGKRRLGMGCEEEATNVVLKMSGHWIPAKNRDKPVRMRFVLPIRFHSEKTK